MRISTITLALFSVFAFTSGCDSETESDASYRALSIGPIVPSTECKTDAHCEPGTVCEPTGPGCGPGNACVPGCHADDDCGADSHCEQFECFTCPCAGQCQPDDPEPYCDNDADCAAGTVCEPEGPYCGPNNICVPGCHSDNDCGAYEQCDQPNCFTCPCPGQCEPTPDAGCVDDSDCGPGTVCELEGPGCGPGTVCVPGCHANADCGFGGYCQQLNCFTCPCPGVCDSPWW